MVPTVVFVLSSLLTTSLTVRFSGSLVVDKLSHDSFGGSGVQTSVAAFVGLLAPAEDEHPALLTLGVLLTLRYLVPLLQQQAKDTGLKGSFGVTWKETEVSPSTEQLVQVGATSSSSACT